MSAPLRALAVAAAAVAVSGFSEARAQEALNMPAATLPSPGTVAVRTQARYLRFRDDPTERDRSGERMIFDTSIQYGLAPEVSISLSAPLEWRRTEFGGLAPAGDRGRREHDFGPGDLTAMLKWRVWREDLGPVDTVRVALLGGLEIPTYVDPFSSESWDPVVGAVVTSIHGRHGLNASFQYTLTTGGEREPVEFGKSLADAIRFDASWLYRIDPAAYTAQTTAATYTVLELNGRYETNGDHQIYLSSGLLYEARTWAAEIGVQIPVYQELDRRPKTDWAVVAGLRFLF